MAFGRLKSSYKCPKLHLDQLEWFTFVQLIVFIPTEILIPVFPYRSPPCGFPTTQHDAVCSLRLTFVSERPLQFLLRDIDSHVLYSTPFHCSLGKRFKTHHGLQLPEGGDLEALHCQPAQKFDRSTQLQFCTSPPIEATRCWQLVFCLSVLVNHCMCRVSVSFSVYFFCLSVSGCVLRFLFFLKGREIFLKTILYCVGFASSLTKLWLGVGSCGF